MSIGPSRPLVLEKPAKIDIPQAARYFGARGGNHWVRLVNLIEF